MVADRRAAHEPGAAANEKPQRQHQQQTGHHRPSDTRVAASRREKISRPR
jgi:hypothetical protein